jgi:hypothetical protein
VGLNLTSREIRFKGTLTNGKATEKNEFAVLANESIEPTNGYAIYAKVKRPQRKSLTILEGYEPMEIEVPILFDTSIAADSKAVETDIQLLEWMAGRGIKFKTRKEGGVGTPGEGNSPLIRIESFDSRGNETPLVPIQYQTATLRWIVTGLAWDKTLGTGVMRDTAGYRTRQAVVVTLTEYVAPAFDDGLNSAADRQKAREAAGNKINVVHAHGREDSIAAIAAYYCHDNKVTGQLLKANSGNRQIGSDPDKKLKTGTAVKVPRNLIRPA